MSFSAYEDPRAAALNSYFERRPESLPTQGVALILRALPGAYLEHLRHFDIRCRQTYRPDADALARLQVGLNDDSEAAPAALAIVFATKHKEETLHHFAVAAESLGERGILIGVAANDLGAPSLEKRCAELMSGVESFSKHKCRVFLARKSADRVNSALLTEWSNASKLRAIPGSALMAAPGMFSWKSIDVGSRLLAERLPADLAGRGADLGAGYGFLAAELLARCPGVRELHLVEAERLSLDAARINLAKHGEHAALHFHWADATAGIPADRLDFVLTNPPFHAGRDADPRLGRAFIRAALGALKPGGRLFFVANRHLPYESELDAQDAEIVSVDQGGGFKVVEARAGETRRR